MLSKTFVTFLRFSRFGSMKMKKENVCTSYLTSCRRLKDLGNFKKIPEMLGFDGEYLAGHPEAKF